MRNRIGLFVVCLLWSAVVRADSDAVKNCIAAWVTSCSKDCATARCVSNCTTQAQDHCAKDITAPQHVFNGPVTSTPIPCANGDTSCGSIVSGTVTNSQFWGGDVTIYVICPSSGEGPATTFIIGRAPISATDGKFTMTVGSTFSGQNGCYGLIAVTPVAGAASHDPGWAPCTGGPCPSP